MRFASIRNMDISDGEGIGVALYTQGCPIHCFNCHNPQTWDYESGTEYTKEHEDLIINLMNKNWINHLAILGGETLISRNLSDLFSLCKNSKENYPDKKIWLWSGYEWDNIINYDIPNYTNEDKQKLKELLLYIDVLVAGPYIDKQRDITLKWRGSANQEVIDVRKSLNQNKKILYCD